MVGTLVNRTVRPSAIVGCVRIASRSPVYGSPASIAAFSEMRPRDGPPGDPYLLHLLLQQSLCLLTNVGVFCLPYREVAQERRPAPSVDHV